MSVRCVFFDLDLTLLDNSGVADTINRTCADIAAHHGDIDVDRLMAANAETWREFWPEVQETWVLGRMETTDVVGETWRRALASLGLVDERLTGVALEAHLRHEPLGHRLYPDAVATLTAIREQGLPMALITNGASDLQRAKLDHVGITDLFDELVISGEVGRAKPDAAIFEMALARLSVDAGDTWHVGDSLDNDVAGAKAAGINAVWINREGIRRTAEDPVPDIEIDNLTALLEWLA